MKKEPSDDSLRTITLDGITIGNPDELVIMAGPCAVESPDQIEQVARTLKELGISIMRGGAYKPRTSPYSFQGLGEEGLEIMDRIAGAHGLQIVTEIMDTAQLDQAARHAQILQVGARSMYNTCLLKALGRRKIPVLLKRGFSSSLDEFLMAAEYIINAGNRRIILCERGIRTFERATRFTLDLSAVAVLKQRTPFPVIVDPSHAAGDASLVPEMAMAAVAAGADALLLEVHPDPAHALCDPKQALRLDELADLVPRLHAVKKACRPLKAPTRPKTEPREKAAADQLL